MEDEEFEIIEGVKLLKTRNAFYNEAQEFNRDLSIAVIKEYMSSGKNIKILETMSASGIRGIRYLKELGKNAKVFFNDIDKKSTEEIRRNISLNNLSNEDFEIFNEDCNALMSKKISFFDVIDIDPFGTCNSFIENAIRAIKHNGLLCVTATDTAVLCSNETKCFAKYNTIIKRSPVCHEIALRTLLSFISRTAAREGAGIEPIVSVSVDFYVRIFIRVIKNNKSARSAIEKNSNFLICTCLNFKEVKLLKMPEFSSLCNICNKRMKLCGPFWNSNLHTKSFVENMILNIDEHKKRMLGILKIITTELNVFCYFPINDLSAEIKCEPTSLKLISSAIINSGYQVSLTHCKLNSIKTDAPLDFLYGVFLKHFNITREGYNFKEYEINLEIRPEITKIIQNTEYKRNLVYSHMGPKSKNNELP